MKTTFLFVGIFLAISTTAWCDTESNKKEMERTRLSAEQGEANAQGILGVMYGAGQGVPQDYVQGHMWSNLAAVSGNSGAIKNREIMAARMPTAQIGEAQQLARAWLEKHSQK